nr:GRIP and coiled-coil domain-containing protein 2-like [Penaeus vannamei]
MLYRSFDREYNNHFSTGTFMPSELVEKVKAQENEIQELLQRNNQTAAVIQQLEGQSLQLQNEVDLRRQEAQQKEDSIGQLEASIRRVKDETLQLLAKGNATEAEKASLQAKTQELKDLLTGRETMYSQKQAIKTQLDQQVAESGSLQAAVDQLNGTVRNVETQNESLTRRKKKCLPRKDESLQMETILVCNAIWKRSSANKDHPQREPYSGTSRSERAQLEAKRKQMEERIRQARTTKQQLQDQLLQLQTKELQRKHEEVQIKTENLAAKSRLQRVEGEKAQVRNAIAKLEQDLQLASDRIQHIETVIPSLRQKIDVVTSGLTQRKNEKLNARTSLSQNVSETEEMTKLLTAENSHLEEEIEHAKADDQRTTQTKTELEQKVNALNAQKAELAETCNKFELYSTSVVYEQQEYSIKDHLAHTQLWVPLKGQQHSTIPYICEAVKNRPC